MAQITFSMEEYVALTKMATKLMEVRRELHPVEWRKPQNKAIKGFAERFYDVSTASDLLEAQTRILSRNDLRIIQELVTVSTTALKQNIVPTYQERVRASPEKVEYYAPYIARALEMQRIYEAILKKVEGAL